MSDLRIRKKIQASRLFGDTQKVDLLVQLEEASDEDKKKLEEGIDVFDREYEAAIKKHSQQVRSLLGHAVKNMSDAEKKAHQEALDTVDFGLALLTP